MKLEHPKLYMNTKNSRYLLRKLIKIGAKFYQRGAPVWQAPLKLVTMILLPFVNKHTERGGIIFHVLRLQVNKETRKEVEPKLI